MDTNADKVLDGVMTVDETGETQPATNIITLTVDEPTRKIIYSGELILGVENDHQAERIYFQLPKTVGHTDVFDLSLDTVQIRIVYTNGYNETYIYNCVDKEPDGDYVKCSWLLTELVTQVKGTVKFIVCAENIVNENSDITMKEAPLVSDNIDGTGSLITYTKPTNLVEYSVSNGVVYGYIKGLGSSEYTPMANVKFSIFVNGSSTASITGVTTDSVYTLTASDLAKLTNADTISIQCDSESLDGDSELESIYYRVEFDFTIDGVETNPVIQNEWHTTPFTGTVLQGIPVDNSTPQEIVSNEVSPISKVINDIEELNNKFDNAVVGYSKAEINTKLADIERTIKDLPSTLPFVNDAGDTMSGNITFEHSDAGRGLIHNATKSAIGFNQSGEPTVINKLSGRRLYIGEGGLASSDVEPYEFPKYISNPVLAMKEDFDLTGTPINISSGSTSLELDRGIYIFVRTDAYDSFILVIGPTSIPLINSSTVMTFDVTEGEGDDNGTRTWAMLYLQYHINNKTLSFTRLSETSSNNEQGSFIYYKLPFAITVG